MGAAQDPSVLEAARNEMRVMRRMGSSENIVQLVAGEETTGRTSQGKMHIICTVMPRCERSVLDILRESHPSPVPVRTILQIMHDVTRGLLALHFGSPPTAHRDIKVENVLYNSAMGVFQLCDFGSCTSDFGAWGREDKATRQMKVEDIERNTTVVMGSRTVLHVSFSHRR